MVGAETASGGFATPQSICPAGKAVTGGGADVTGGAGYAILGGYTLEPDQVSALAYELTAPPASWSARSFTICGPPLPGQEVEVSTSASNSVAKSITAPCAPGKVVVGGGATVSGAVVGVVMSNMTLADDLGHLSATAFEQEGGTTLNWTLHAYAVCASPPRGLTQVTAKFPLESDPQSVTAVCPAGKILLGGAAQLQNAPGEVVFDDIRPDDRLTSLTVTGFEDATGTTSSWRPIAHALCANP
jgi:hypothetical protein